MGGQYERALEGMLPQDFPRNFSRSVVIICHWHAAAGLALWNANYKNGWYDMESVVSIMVIALLVWGVFIYNRLVRDRNRACAAWSDIDVQLKRRYDLIPKLVDAVRHYAAYEKATFSAITELRRQAQSTESVSERAHLESGLGDSLHRLIAVAEQYPQLKANLGFLELQKNLADVEDHVQYARRYYNGSVRNLNTRIDTFPDLLIARSFGFSYASHFELESASERHTPEYRQ